MIHLADCRSLLIFGGTFDPPHVAHVALPAMVRDRLGMDLLAYIPAAQSPLKINQEPTPAHHRLAMLRLALEQEARSIILTDELDHAQPGRPSYTIDTLRRLSDRLGPGVKLRLLIGADQLRLFDRWREHEAIEKLAEPVVMMRPPDTAEMVLSGIADPQRRTVWASRLVELPLMPVSSTEIRRRLVAGQSVADMVPAAVLEYIFQQGLYGTGGAGSTSGKARA